MYICNLKLNTKKILIICLVIAIVVTLGIEIASMSSKKTTGVTYDYELNDSNFTTVLKSVHEDINSNIGKTIKVSGFVFKLYDFKENNFVCGRDMVLDGEEKVVGFLCEYENAKDIAYGEWVEITGTIKLGYYMCEMPVIQIESLKKIPAPANTFVEPPKDM